MIEQLAQLRTVTWDGNLISKTHRDELVKAGLAERAHGWNWITAKGVEYLFNLGYLRAQPLSKTMENTSNADSQTVVGLGSTALLGSVFLLDNDGAEVRHGDTIGFSYGIPSVGVRAQVVQRGKSLFALTPGHTPAECNLRSLRRYIGEWFRLPNDQDQTIRPSASAVERPRANGGAATDCL